MKRTYRPSAGINEGIEELFWLAAVKPTTIGVPEYRDDAGEYLEIAVLRLSLRTGAKTTLPGQTATQSPQPLQRSVSIRIK